MTDGESTVADTRGGLGALLYRRPKVVLAFAFAVVAVSAVLLPGLHSSLASGWTDFDDADAPNVAAKHVVEGATGIDTQQGYILIVHLDQPVTVSGPPPERLRVATDVLRSRPEVKSVVDYTTPAMAGLLSQDRRSVAVFAQVGSVVDKKVVPELRADLRAQPSLDGHVDIGGTTSGGFEITSMILTDLTRAEIIVFPALFVLLIIVFRGVVAALAPLIGSAVTVLLATLALGGVVEFVPISVYSLNLILAMGLGLSIDFSLLITSRYREELARCGSVPDALRTAMRTAGRTVLFSALTVTTAMVALLVFPQRIIWSMGVGGILASLAALTFALIVLPALLGLLGTRVEKWAPARWQRSTRADDGVDPSARRWRAIALHVMRRPALYATGATLLLLVLASPLAGVTFTGAESPTVLPMSAAAGRVAAELGSEFPRAVTDQEQLVIDGTRADGARVAEYLRDVGRVDGVVGVTPARQIDPGHWLASVGLTGPPISEENQAALRSIADIDTSLTVRATGATADVIELNSSLGRHLPYGILVLVGATLVMLFAMTASVVLPLKAILMNTLSLGASLGIIVLIFQHGWLSGVFNLRSTGAIESTSPIYLGAVAFALSTDYGMFLLGRIKELRDRGFGDREAIATGIERTGRIVTSAAGLFCLAMCALLISRLEFIKQLGLGAALAVIIDATIVRAVLVPTLMTLLGSANWWAPRPLRRLHRALRLDRIHSEEDSTPSPVPPERLRTG